MTGPIRQVRPDQAANCTGITSAVVLEIEPVIKQYLEDLTVALAKIEIGPLSDFAEELIVALNNGRRVYIAGNGGSSTAAIHIASDLMAASGSLAGPPQVIALTENVARITAIANDYSYDEIFSRQISDHGARGDVLLLLSVSGNSPNLVRAARTGREREMTVLAALGNAGSVSEIADRTVVFGQADYGLTEDLHVAFGHILVRLLRYGRASRHDSADEAYSAK
jgi:D-sedoheptulose 7-phosphate isomerase